MGRPPGGREAPEEEFLAQQGLIRRVISFTCRRQHLRAEEAEEFASTVMVKLVEDDYAVFRKFQGQSSLPTYLTTVIQRLCLDFLRARRGRPRASAEARRLGPVAMQLERLLYWDGFGFDEACRILKDNHGVEASWEELEEMAGRLPSRAIGRHHEGGERTEQLVGAIERPDEALSERERAEEEERVVAALEEALADARRGGPGDPADAVRGRVHDRRRGAGAEPAAKAVVSAGGGVVAAAAAGFGGAGVAGG